MATPTTPYVSRILKHDIQTGTIQPRVLFGLLVTRSFLCFLGQAATAGILAAQGRPDPWMVSVPYWNIFGTVADVGCLLVLRSLLKKEGRRIWDLVRVPGVPLGRDLLIGVGLFLVLFPTAIIGVSLLANLVIYGTLQPDLGTGLLTARQLPTWAKLYSLLVWWVLWSPTESMYYNGYLFPRFVALTGRTSWSILLVGFFWTLQHIFYPFMPDPAYLVWRFLQFLAIGMLMPWLFSRLRRLRPLIITHWLMDIASVLATLKL